MGRRSKRIQRRNSRRSELARPGTIISDKVGSMLKRIAAIAGIIVLLLVVVALAYLVHQHREDSLRSPATEPDGPLVLIESATTKEIA